MIPPPQLPAKGKVPKLSLKPKKARSDKGCGDSWWYDDRGSIHVLIQPDRFTNAVSCRIKRSALLKYIKRSSP